MSNMAQVGICPLAESYNSGGKKHLGHHLCVKSRKRLEAKRRNKVHETAKAAIAREVAKEAAKRQHAANFQALVDKYTTEYTPKAGRRRKRR